MSFPQCPDDSTLKNAFSVLAAAQECPNQVALMTEDRSITFAELAQMVKDRQKTLVHPEPHRPYCLTAQVGLETLIDVYTLLEDQIPFLLLHPSLTPRERDELINRTLTIQSPLPEGAQAILFTSGTTGFPKPAVLTRRALWASAMSNAANCRLTHDDIWLLAMSVARVGGLSIITRSLLARSTVALAGKFTVEGFIRELSRTKATLVSIVPTMLTRLLNEAPEWEVPSTLRALLLGGSSASAQLLKRAQAKHIPVMCTYGMTETASNVVTTPYEDRYNALFGTGTVNQGVEIKIENGFIYVRGPMLMAGYWGQAPLAEDGWFQTGDMGELDDQGRLTVHARRADLIVTGGDNVYPAEVENVLETIPGIKEARVVGLPDEEWGAIVSALLVPEGKPLTPEDCVKAIRPRLSPYKCPRRIAWVSSLPVLSNGKPNRQPEILKDVGPLITLHWTNKTSGSH